MRLPRQPLSSRRPRRAVRTAGITAARPGWPYLDKLDPWSSHSRIRWWLREEAPGSRVLDVGTATGTLGRLCAGQGLVLRGLEPNPEWAELARPFYAELMCGALDAADEAFLSGHQVVICADVLEHIAHPEAALERLISLQPPGCRFIISVPNVANIWVRLNLLLGRFDYADRGILDRTHLRFFTRRSFVAMLEGAGLEAGDLEVTPIPLDLVHAWFRQSAAGRSLHAALAAATRRWPTMLGYQFVARAYKPGTRGDHG